jgi:metabotropic glutamate receptor 6/7/8
LKIPREVKPDTFRRIIDELKENQKAKVVILFVNEDNCRHLVKTSIDMQVAGTIHWLASDSWGSKAVPVNGQEPAAEGTITILPTRNVLRGIKNSLKNLYIIFVVLQNLTNISCD